MKKFMGSLLAASLLAQLSVAAAQEFPQGWATYITRQQWMTVNEEPGVDRQLVSRDIGKLNLSVGIIHRGSTRQTAGRGGAGGAGGGGGGGGGAAAAPCGITNDLGRNSGASGILHMHQTETYIVVQGSGVLVTGGQIMNGRLSAPESSVTTTLNGPSCSGAIVGDWVSKHVYEGDIIIMPAGTPHGWLDVPVGVDYLSVRPDPDRVLPDDYTNPALGSGFQMRTPQGN
jgi:mannose-6-phosphate isomerase-like protein (cupin superfamily)